TFGGRKRLFHAPLPGIKAVKKVSLTLRRGETVGVVGESGSGKSTLARCIIRLLDVDQGQILLDSVDITRLSRKELRPWRKKIQMIFQDPYESLNPRMTVGQLVAQGPLVHGETLERTMARVRELL